MIYIGIDPGFDGAIAAIDQQGRVVRVYDTPTLEVKGGAKKKRVMDVLTVVKLINRMKDNTDEHIRASLEDVHSMPKQGVASSFSFGRGLGIWEGLLCALGIPVQMVSPQKWKKVMMDGMGKHKDASRLVAQRMFPDADLHLKKHHGRADALLMAAWLRRLEMGGENK